VYYNWQMNVLQCSNWKRIYKSVIQLYEIYNIFIPPYGSMVGILSLLCLCLFVRSPISERRKKIAARNFACLFNYYLGSESKNEGLKWGRRMVGYASCWRTCCNLSDLNQFLLLGEQMHEEVTGMAWSKPATSIATNILPTAPPCQMKEW